MGQGQTEEGHLSSARVLDHLAGRPVDRLPVMPITMMFAADLIGVHFRDYCRDHELLVRAQLATAEAFGFDHVSCISDSTREATDCGAVIEWLEDGPAIDERMALLTDRSTLAKIRVPDPAGGGRMTDQLRAAEMFRALCGGRFVIEGWVEGPCAEAAVLRGINALMLDFYDDPAFVNELFEFTTRMALDFARAQIAAGVDIVGVGDAAASLVGPEIYAEFVWPHEKRLVEEIHKLGAAVRLHICGNTRRIIDRMAGLGCEIVDVDSPVSLAHARVAAGPDQVLLGNLDPVREMLNSTAGAVREAVARCHFQAGARFIVGAGCEIPRGTPAANVAALAEYARAEPRRLEL